MTDYISNLIMTFSPYPNIKGEAELVISFYN